MALKCGIVGMPNVGKSTIFNALTSANISAENYPFCTIDPHLGIVEVPDAQLYKIADVINPEKITPTTVTFTDIAGLVKGASKGEGLGNKFLSHIKEVDAILHVVRCFEDKDITHVEGRIDPVNDAYIIETELLLSDIEILEKRLLKTEKRFKSNHTETKKEYELLKRLLDHCNNGLPAKTFSFFPTEKELIKSLNLLTLKPMLYIANLEEESIINDTNNKIVSDLNEFVKKKKEEVIFLCGKIEEEISSLEIDEKHIFLKEYNLIEPGLFKLINKTYKLLQLSNFYTCGPKEVRSWTIPKNSTAVKAAGTIHTDFQRGFIKAEIYHSSDLIRLGSEQAVKKAGLVKLEGKDYLVKNGDCIYFRFNI
tara:strand:+ start:1124 stop:2224 length:1101 start_codon:yes stop_codon:yes gene_type:complete